MTAATTTDTIDTGTAIGTDGTAGTGTGTDRDG